MALPHDGGPGRPTPETVVKAAGSPGPDFALNTTLLCSEALITSPAVPSRIRPNGRKLVDAARSRGLKVHLDGARLWNAAVALDVSPTELTSGADTVQVCLSKGLGAPVGRYSPHHPN